LEHSKLFLTSKAGTFTLTHPLTQNTLHLPSFLVQFFIPQVSAKMPLPPREPYLNFFLCFLSQQSVLLLHGTDEHLKLYIFIDLFVQCVTPPQNKKLFVV
jgi:hypothetical protein